MKTTRKEFVDFWKTRIARTFREARNNSYRSGNWIDNAAAEVAEYCVDFMEELGEEQLKELVAMRKSKKDKNAKEAKN